MALLQIAEPGQSPMPHQSRRAIGIDLGTTNSLVAAVLEEGAQPLADAQGAKMLPSVVHYASDGTVKTGLEAQSHAFSHPADTLVSVNERFTL